MSKAFRQPSVLPRLKTPTTGHHDADCRSRHGNAGSDNSGSLLDPFEVTVLRHQPACAPRPMRPNVPVFGRPKVGLLADCQKNLRLTERQHGPDSMAAISASLASTFLLGAAECSRAPSGTLVGRIPSPHRSNPSGGGPYFLGHAYAGLMCSLTTAVAERSALDISGMMRSDMP